MLVVERGAGGGGGVQGSDWVLLRFSAARMSALAQSLDQHLAQAPAVNEANGNGEVFSAVDWASVALGSFVGYGSIVGVEAPQDMRVFIPLFNYYLRCKVGLWHRRYILRLSTRFASAWVVSPGVCIYRLHTLDYFPSWSGAPSNCSMSTTTVPPSPRYPRLTS